MSGDEIFGVVESIRVYTEAMGPEGPEGAREGQRGPEVIEGARKCQSGPEMAKEGHRRPTFCIRSEKLTDTFYHRRINISYLTTNILMSFLILF